MEEVEIGHGDGPRPLVDIDSPSPSPLTLFLSQASSSTSSSSSLMVASTSTLASTSSLVASSTEDKGTNDEAECTVEIDDTDLSSLEFESSDDEAGVFFGAHAPIERRLVAKLSRSLRLTSPQSSPTPRHVSHAEADSHVFFHSSPATTARESPETSFDYDDMPVGRSPMVVPYTSPSAARMPSFSPSLFGALAPPPASLDTVVTAGEHIDIDLDLMFMESPLRSPQGQAQQQSGFVSPTPVTVPSTPALAARTIPSTPAAIHATTPRRLAPLPTPASARVGTDITPLRAAVPQPSVASQRPLRVLKPLTGPGVTSSSSSVAEVERVQKARTAIRGQLDAAFSSKFAAFGQPARSVSSSSSASAASGSGNGAVVAAQQHLPRRPQSRVGESSRSVISVTSANAAAGGKRRPKLDATSPKAESNAMRQSVASGGSRSRVVVVKPSADPDLGSSAGPRHADVSSSTRPGPESSTVSRPTIATRPATKLTTHPRPLTASTNATNRPSRPASRMAPPTSIQPMTSKLNRPTIVVKSSIPRGPTSAATSAANANAAAPVAHSPATRKRPMGSAPPVSLARSIVVTASAQRPTLGLPSRMGRDGWESLEPQPRGEPKEREAREQASVFTATSSSVFTSSSGSIFNTSNGPTSDGAHAPTQPHGHGQIFAQQSRSGIRSPVPALGRRLFGDGPSRPSHTPTTQRTFKMGTPSRLAPTPIKNAATALELAKGPPVPFSLSDSVTKVTAGTQLQTQSKTPTVVPAALEGPPSTEADNNATTTADNETTPAEPSAQNGTLGSTVISSDPPNVVSEEQPGSVISAAEADAGHGKRPRRTVRTPTPVVVPVPQRGRSVQPVTPSIAPNMSEKELKTATHRNTMRNQVYLCAIDRHIVRVPGPRPPSPTSKIRTTEQREEEVRKASREERARRRRSGSGSGNDDDTDDEGQSLPLVERVDHDAKHPGDEDDYATPTRPSKRPRVRGGSEDTTTGTVATRATISTRYVHWDRCLTVIRGAYGDSRSTPSSHRTQNGSEHIKSCIRDAARISLDQHGNVVGSKRPVEKLKRSKITVTAVFYDGEEPVPIPSSGTRSKSKK